jgi:hypothetical protein
MGIRNPLDEGLPVRPSRSCRSGAIGKVKEVHTWELEEMGRPRRAAGPRGCDSSGFQLGPLARARAPIGPTSATSISIPATGGSGCDFGTGTFGDMGCHIFDPVFEALALTAPLSLRSEGPSPDAWNWSTDAHIKYVFPGTRFTADKTVEVTWYDGDQRPPEHIRALIALPKSDDPKVADADAKKKKAATINEGSIIIGTEGVLHVPHIATPKLFPIAKFKDYKLPEVAGSHHWSDWAEACTGGPAKPLAPFDLLRSADRSGAARQRGRALSPDDAGVGHRPAAVHEREVRKPIRAARLSQGLERGRPLRSQVSPYPRGWNQRPAARVVRDDALA